MKPPHKRVIRKHINVDRVVDQRVGQIIWSRNKGNGEVAKEVAKMFADYGPGTYRIRYYINGKLQTIATVETAS